MKAFSNGLVEHELLSLLRKKVPYLRNSHRCPFLLAIRVLQPMLNTVKGIWNVLPKKKLKTKFVFQYLIGTENLSAWSGVGAKKWKNNLPKNYWPKREKTCISPWYRKRIAKPAISITSLGIPVCIKVFSEKNFFLILAFESQLMTVMLYPKISSKFGKNCFEPEKFVILCNSCFCAIRGFSGNTV